MTHTIIQPKGRWTLQTIFDADILRVDEELFGSQADQKKTASPQQKYREALRKNPRKLGAIKTLEQLLALIHYEAEERRINEAQATLQNKQAFQNFIFQLLEAHHEVLGNFIENLLSEVANPPNKQPKIETPCTVQEIPQQPTVSKKAKKETLVQEAQQTLKAYFAKEENILAFFRACPKATQSLSRKTLITLTEKHPDAYHRAEIRDRLNLSFKEMYDWADRSQHNPKVCKTIASDPGLYEKYKTWDGDSNQALIYQQQLKDNSIYFKAGFELHEAINKTKTSFLGKPNSRVKKFLKEFTQKVPNEKEQTIYQAQCGLIAACADYWKHVAIPPTRRGWFFGLFGRTQKQVAAEERTLACKSRHFADRIYSQEKYTPEALFQLSLRFTDPQDAEIMAMVEARLMNITYGYERSLNFLEVINNLQKIPQSHQEFCQQFKSKLKQELKEVEIRAKQAIGENQPMLSFYPHSLLLKPTVVRTKTVVANVPATQANTKADSKQSVTPATARGTEPKLTSQQILQEIKDKVLERNEGKLKSPAEETKQGPTETELKDQLLKQEESQKQKLAELKKLQEENSKQLNPYEWQRKKWERPQTDREGKAFDFGFHCAILKVKIKKGDEKATVEQPWRDLIQSDVNKAFHLHAAPHHSDLHRGEAKLGPIDPKKREEAIQKIRELFQDVINSIIKSPFDKVEFLAEGDKFSPYHVKSRTITLQKKKNKVKAYWLAGLAMLTEEIDLTRRPDILKLFPKPNQKKHIKENEAFVNEIAVLFGCTPRVDHIKELLLEPEPEVVRQGIFDLQATAKDRLTKYLFDGAFKENGKKGKKEQAQQAQDQHWMHEGYFRGTRVIENLDQHYNCCVKILAMFRQSEISDEEHARKIAEYDRRAEEHIASMKGRDLEFKTILQEEEKGFFETLKVKKETGDKEGYHQIYNQVISYSSFLKKKLTKIGLLPISLDYLIGAEQRLLQDKETFERSLQRAVTTQTTPGNTVVQDVSAVDRNARDIKVLSPDYAPPLAGQTRMQTLARVSTNTADLQTNKSSDKLEVDPKVSDMQTKSNDFPQPPSQPIAIPKI